MMTMAVPGVLHPALLVMVFMLGMVLVMLVVPMRWMVAFAALFHMVHGLDPPSE
jgi:hypothetical protein